MLRKAAVWFSCSIPLLAGSVHASAQSCQPRKPDGTPCISMVESNTYVPAFGTEYLQVRLRNSCGRYILVDAYRRDGSKGGINVPPGKIGRDYCQAKTCGGYESISVYCDRKQPEEPKIKPSRLNVPDMPKEGEIEYDGTTIRSRSNYCGGVSDIGDRWVAAYRSSYGWVSDEEARKVRAIMASRARISRQLCNLKQGDDRLLDLARKHEETIGQMARIEVRMSERYDAEKARSQPRQASSKTKKLWNQPRIGWRDKNGFLSCPDGAMPLGDNSDCFYPQ